MISLRRRCHGADAVGIRQVPTLWDAEMFHHFFTVHSVSSACKRGSQFRHNAGQKASTVSISSRVVLDRVNECCCGRPRRQGHGQQHMEGSRDPDAQAEPDDAAMPFKSRCSSSAPSIYRKDRLALLGRRFSRLRSVAHGECRKDAVNQAVAQGGHLFSVIREPPACKLRCPAQPTTPATFSVPALRTRSAPLKKR